MTIHIIRPGNAVCDRVMAGRCRYCGCQVECSYRDTKPGNFHDMPGSYIDCPTEKCNRRISMHFIHPKG